MKNILIINLMDTGNEAEALRQVLEYMNFFVGIKSIGRPMDFMEILSGQIPFDPDCIIISCHGDNEKICMPALEKSVYYDNEPQGDFSYQEIAPSFNLSGKTIINLGYTTGRSRMSAVFSENNTYIAPWITLKGMRRFSSQ